VNPLFNVLTRWAETLANGTAQLDPLTRARLDALAGHSIAVEVNPPGEAATLYFENRVIRLNPGIGAAPSVIVRGRATALATAFFSTSAGRGGMTIEGDELILAELRSIVRDFHPELIPPLDQLVGENTSQAITSLMEFGLATLSALGRSVSEEGNRFVRAGARLRYLGAADFETLLASIKALRVRVDRLDARTEIVERSSPRNE
jgi:ubiquinone biosynthesis protein UbiJ